MRKIFKWAGLGLLLIVAISFLGGSAIWTILGFTDDLRIDGTAEVVRSVPDDMGASWTAYGGDAGVNRFSNAVDITPENASTLVPAWTYRSGTFEGREHLKSRASLQTTPILVEDALVFCTQFNEIISVNPETGEENWRYDAQVPLDGRPANEFSCRGVSYRFGELPQTPETCGSRLYMGTVDARLVSVNALTG